MNNNLRSNKLVIIQNYREEIFYGPGYQGFFILLSLIE